MSKPGAAGPVLFVCVGNRVRSPLAQGWWRHRLRRAGVDAARAHALADSAGTHAWPGGEAPSAEAVFEAARRGVDIADLRSRALEPHDFARARLVLAMDWDSLALAEAVCPPEHRTRLRGLAEFQRRHHDPVIPDPADVGFDALLARLDDACDGLWRWWIAHGA